jgi:hypothetical protein
VRLAAVALLALVALVVWRGGVRAIAVENGQWDASTAAERTRYDTDAGGDRSLAVWSWLSDILNPRRRVTFVDKAMTAPYVPPVMPPSPHGRAPRPNLSRLGQVANRTFGHPGKSRVEGRTGYSESRLPSLDEAFAFLHPHLNAVKDRTPQVPREHILNAPLFPSYLTKDLLERYAHLQQEVDEETGEWLVGTEKRYLFVTVCRQVAGMLADWYATWTLITDFLGPESCIFSLHEGGSDDGRWVFVPRLN